MKKLILLIFLFVNYGISTTAQDSNTKTICLPDSIVSSIIDELIIKDHLYYTLNQKDSILTIYQEDLKKQNQEIVQLKLNAKDYEKIIVNLNEDLKLEKQTTKELRKQNTLGKLVSFMKGVLVTATAVVIYIVVHSSSK